MQRRVENAARWELLTEFMRDPDKLAAHLEAHCSTNLVQQGSEQAVYAEALLQPQGQGPIPAAAPMMLCTNVTHFKAWQQCASAGDPISFVLMQCTVCTALLFVMMCCRQRVEAVCNCLSRRPPLQSWQRCINTALHKALALATCQLGSCHACA